MALDQGRQAYLVAKTLRGNDRNLIAETLVGLEVERELGVVTLDHNLGGPLDGLQSSLVTISFIPFMPFRQTLTLVLTRPILAVVCWLVDVRLAVLRNGRPPSSFG